MTDAFSARTSLCVVPCGAAWAHVVGHLGLLDAEAIWCVRVSGELSARQRVALKRGVSRAAAEGAGPMVEAALGALGDGVSVACAILRPEGASWAVQGGGVALWGHGAGRLEGSGRTACLGLLAASGGFTAHAADVVARWSGSAKCPHGALLEAFPSNMCVAASVLGVEGLSGGAFAIALA